MSYIGRGLQSGAFRQLDSIASSFNGSTTGFTMQVNGTNVIMGDANQILLSLGGVIQNPGTDFTISSSTLTFTTAPATGTSFFAILLGSDNGGTTTPTDLSVTGGKLATDIAITTSGDISFDGGSFVFNESSADKDFRVESNGKANMLFVDGGNDRVNMGASTDVAATLVVSDGDSGQASPTANGNTFVIEKNDNCGLTILSANDAYGCVLFGDDGDADIGKIEYDHSNNKFMFSAGANHVMQMTSTQVTVNEDSDDVDFRVESDGCTTLFNLQGVNSSNALGSIGINSSNADGNLVEINNSSSGVYCLKTIDSNSSGNVYMNAWTFTGQNPDDNTSLFCGANDQAGGRFQVKSDGDVVNHDNSYGSMSDERIKQDIVDSGSQWDDIKAVKVRKFKKKDDVRQYGDKAWVQIGVIAQELEAAGMDKLIKHSDPVSSDIKSSSEFGTLYTADDAETKDGEDAILWTADENAVKSGLAKAGEVKTEATHSKKVGDVKEIKAQVKKVGYSVLYMKAIKALQEAQTRIETLETKVAALEG